MNGEHPVDQTEQFSFRINHGGRAMLHVEPLIGENYRKLIYWMADTVTRLGIEVYAEHNGIPIYIKPGTVEHPINRKKIVKAYLDEDRLRRAAATSVSQLLLPANV